MAISNTPSPLSNIIAAKTYNAAWFSGSTKELQITAAIAAAATDGALYVYIPANMLPYTASQVTFKSAIKMVREGGDFSGFDIQAYGADKLGVINSTTSIQSPITEAKTNVLKAVSIPAGDYLTDDLAVSGTGVSIEGVGSARMYGSIHGSSSQLSARDEANVTMIDCAPAGGLGYPTDPMTVSIKHLHLHGRDKVTNGIRTSASAYIEDVSIEHVESIAFWIAQYTNSTRLKGVFGELSGVGLFVTGNPNATTPFTVEDGNFNLNTSSVGAIVLQAGVHVRFVDIIAESNVGPGLSIYRPNGVNTGCMEFNNVWLEDNGSGAGFLESLNIDAQTRNEANAPYNILFDRCRINPSIDGRKYMVLACVKDLEFRDCDFAGTTAAAAITTTATCYDVVFVRCKGITEAQMLSAMASGNERVWFANEKFAMSVVYSAWVGDPSLYAWKDREGNIHMAGGIKNGIVGVGNTAFVLPVGLRPAVTKQLPVMSAGVLGEMTIATTGEVVIISGNNTGVTLDHISFSARET